MTTEKPWGWYASSDEENYYCGPEQTRDAIIQAATNDEIGLNDDGSRMFFIIEAWQASVELADHFEAAAFVDAINDDFSDFGGLDGEPVVDMTDVAVNSLERVVRATIAKWQADNNLRFRNWTFSETRNREAITIAPDQAAKGE